MKTSTSVLLLLLLLQTFIASAQIYRYQKQYIKIPDTGITSVDTVQREGKVLTPKLVVYPNPVQHQLVFSSINIEEYDKALIYNMQGALTLQQPIKTTVVRFDVSGLDDGLYLLVLRSTATFKESSIKFVVKN